MNNEDELFEACINLRRKLYNLEDKMEEILDYLIYTHITKEEFEVVQEIANRKEKDNEQSYVNRTSY